MAKGGLRNRSTESPIGCIVHVILNSIWHGVMVKNEFSRTLKKDVIRIFCYGLVRHSNVQGATNGTK